MQFIQPGRFVLPGELEGAPVLQFSRYCIYQKNNGKIEKEAKSNSYFAVLNKRYDYYRNKVVKGFYENYFSTFDRQVILADCLTPLNHSQQAFIDMQTGLNQLFKISIMANAIYLIVCFLRILISSCLWQQKPIISRQIKFKT